MTFGAIASYGEMAPCGRANPATGPQDVNLIVLLEKGRLDLKFETALPFDCFLFDPFKRLWVASVFAFAGSHVLIRPANSTI